MDKDKILKMVAGSEIDTYIAKKIMEFRQLPVNFSPSTNIADAVSVLAKMRLMVRPSVLADKWVAMKFERVYLSGKWEGIGEVTDDTIELAICKAAILEHERGLTSRAADVCPGCGSEYVPARNIDNPNDEVCAKCGHRR